MRRLRPLPPLVLAAVFLTGCDSQPSDEQIAEDLRAAVMRVEPVRDLIIVHDVMVTDGWDDAAEIEVRYTSACSRPTDDCAPRARTEPMSYERRWVRID